MSKTLDVTGLAPDAIQAMESLIRIMRDKMSPQPSPASIFDLIGKAPVLRSGEEIAQQIQEEREAWGDS